MSAIQSSLRDYYIPIVYQKEVKESITIIIDRINEN